MTEVDYCREMYQVVGLSRLALVLQPEVREGAQGGQAGCEKESSLLARGRKGQWRSGS